MIPLETLGRATTADGQDLVLYHRDGVFVIRVDGLELMSSNAHGSETALADYAFESLGDVSNPRVLIGGLGMGFTLRAALDCFPKSATIEVAELFAEVVEWNRGPLSHLARRPLDDPRVRLQNTDVANALHHGLYDVILLDVDNGPGAFTVSTNDRLYGPAGIKQMMSALKDKGVLAIWSATVEPQFERQVQKLGFEIDRRRARARGSGGGARHTIYLIRRGSSKRRGPRPTHRGQRRRSGKRRR